MKQLAVSVGLELENLPAHDLLCPDVFLRHARRSGCKVQKRKGKDKWLDINGQIVQIVRYINTLDKEKKKREKRIWPQANQPVIFV